MPQTPFAQCAVLSEIALRTDFTCRHLLAVAGTSPLYPLPRQSNSSDPCLGFCKGLDSFWGVAFSRRVAGDFVASQLQCKSRLLHFSCPQNNVHGGTMRKCETEPQKRLFLLAARGEILFFSWPLQRYGLFESLVRGPCRLCSVRWSLLARGSRTGWDLCWSEVVVMGICSIYRPRPCCHSQFLQKNLIRKIKS